MGSYHKSEKTIWWISHNNNDVFHYGKAEENQHISSGQPFLEIFDNVVEWENRLQILLPPDKYIQFNENIEEDKQTYGEVNKLKGYIDDLLYTDSVDSDLYEDKEFRIKVNLNKREN